MRKVKFFICFMKERDWLEEMASKGWLLTNMSLGIIYQFKPIEPSDKVYEVERFAVGPGSSITDLTARGRALDIAGQCGWEQVTHDEDMNYYFVKDRAGDETDEFYDNEEARRERAERYRRRFCIELPCYLLICMLAVGILYLYASIYWDENLWLQKFLFQAYICFTLVEILLILFTSHLGQHLHREFCMSREEWKKHKLYSEKRRFNKVQQLRVYLQEKSEMGLSLQGYENGRWVFEKDSARYNYFIDSKSCLKKRMKKEGLSFRKEKKDWYAQSLKWYEVSISDAARYHLKPVAVVRQSILIYKRPFSDELLPWENGNENLWLKHPVVLAGITLILILTASYFVGYMLGILSRLFLI